MCRSAKPIAALLFVAKAQIACEKVFFTLPFLSAAKAAETCFGIESRLRAYAVGRPIEKGRTPLNENQMQALLKLAAQRLNTTPEALRSAAENGDLQNITGNTNSPQAEQLRRVLRDPEAAKKLLSTPAAQKLFEALGGQK